MYTSFTPDSHLERSTSLDRRWTFQASVDFDAADGKACGLGIVFASSSAAAATGGKGGPASPGGGGRGGVAVKRLKAGGAAAACGAAIGPGDRVLQVDGRGGLEAMSKASEAAARGALPSKR
jgi:C-terminal processing protease CtpA/Prc